jgi:hypothetical protein
MFSLWIHVQCDTRQCDMLHIWCFHSEYMYSMIHASVTCCTHGASIVNTCTVWDDTLLDVTLATFLGVYENGRRQASFVSSESHKLSHPAAQSALCPRIWWIWYMYDTYMMDMIWYIYHICKKNIYMMMIYHIYTHYIYNRWWYIIISYIWDDDESRGTLIARGSMNRNDNTKFWFANGHTGNAESMLDTCELKPWVSPVRLNP